MTQKTPQKLLGNLPKGIVFVVSAPAGTGKTTLVRRLCQEFSCVETSVSCTTREPRTGEQEGKDYWFLTPEAFEKKEQEGGFLETATVFAHKYATSKVYVQNIIDRGHHAVLIIDTQGALYLKHKGFSAVFIFLLPPSIEALVERLDKRKTEDKEKQKLRLSCAKEEMRCSIFYDYRIINDDIDVAYETLRSIFIAEEHKVRKQGEKIL